MSATSSHSGAWSSPGLTGGTSGRLGALDGLRAVAAGSVLVYHCWLFSSPARFTWNLGPLTPFMQPLQAGVVLFFVLSGFLLYLPIARSLVAGGERPSLRRYLRNRAFRILPAYWLILGISGFLLHSSIIGGGRGGLVAGTPSVGLFAQDATFVANAYPATFGTGILPAWSLSIEVAFYLVLPLLALAAYATAAARPQRDAAAALVPPALLVCIGLAVNIAGVAFISGYGRGLGTSWSVVLRQSFLAHADLFGYGMAAAVACTCVQAGAPRLARTLARPATGRLLAYVGLPTWVLGFYALPRTAYDSVLGCLLAVAIARLVVRSAESGRKTRLLERRWLIACGLGSYSAFLWHYPLLTFLARKGMLADPGGAVAVLENVLLAGSLTIVASFLTYRYVEAPALAFAHRRAATRSPSPAAAKAGLA
jgi:peptidoglycan/LPS O-acetylase OafA/YrhL